MQIKMVSLLLFAFLIGCQSSHPTALERSLQEYNQGQWILSEMWANKSIAAKKNIGESQYVIGLCEFKQQRISDSEMWFEKAATSSNREVHAKATAMLGIISSNKGDYASAEVAFVIAAAELEGIDRSEATKRTTNNNRNFQINDAYTLQFGAFRDVVNANATVSAIDPSLVRAGISPAWITQTVDRTGRSMYLVQAGRFSTRISASKSRKLGNLPQCIVTATD